MTDWLYPLLRCPVCRGNLEFRPFDAARSQGLLEHNRAGCGELYPVIDDVPRMLVGAARGELVRGRREWFAARDETAGLAVRWESTAAGADPVIAGFDDEWRRFRDVGTAEQSHVFDMYFDLVPPTCFAPELTALDAGSGAGRWAFEVSRRGPRVIAVDLGRSIEVTRANTPPSRVACIQADVGALPLAQDAVDWAYSLGVLHHTNAPEVGLANIVGSVRPGGLVLLYLYYALDQRGPIFRGVFQAVDLARRFISRQPRAAARAMATVITASIYWPLARGGAILGGRATHQRPYRSLAHSRVVLGTRSARAQGSDRTETPDAEVCWTTALGHSGIRRSALATLRRVGRNRSCVVLR